MPRKQSETSTQTNFDDKQDIFAQTKLQSRLTKKNIVNKKLFSYTNKDINNSMKNNLKQNQNSISV